MEKNNLVFLDLEGTIIDTWENGSIGNSRVIKSFIDTLDVDCIYIYSFAIHDDNDKNDFKLRFQDKLEDLLDKKIYYVYSVEEVMKEILKDKKISLEKNQLLQVYGKDLSFDLFCNRKFKNKNCYLIDDMVPNKEIINFDSNNSIKYISIDKLIYDYKVKKVKCG